MATIYVSKTGDDGNSGTRDSPVLSVARAAKLCTENDGEIIIMDNGTYNEGQIGLNNPVLTATGITIMAETGSNGLPLVSPILEGSGSGNTQSSAFNCAAGWTIKGITFQNYDIANSANTSVINNRSTVAGAGALTIELCTFRQISGSCINISNGDAGSDPGLHIIKSNTFHDILTKDTQKAIIIMSTRTNDVRKAKIVNNVFYDWQPQGLSHYIIFGGHNNAAGPDTIISHNTFGTSSIGSFAQAGTGTNFSIDSVRSKFEYNIIKDQTNVYAFADLANGEANYNIYHNVNGGAGNAPFGSSTAPTSSVNNQEIDPQLRGPLIGNSANYRLAGPSSPAFDAAIGSSDVTNDRTGVSRTTLDFTAYGTGIFDIGAFEVTGLWSAESPDELSQFGADFTINRIPNADNQRQRALQEGNSGTIGRDVNQVPLGTAINGAVPSIIRKRPTAYKQDSGKKGT